MSTGVALLVALFLILLNGFFVAVEFALIRVRSTRIAELSREGRRAAKMAEHAIHHLDVYLSASQVGISIASIALGYVAEPAIVRLLTPLFHSVPMPEAWHHAIAIAIALSIVSSLHIVVGEQAPKYWAIQNAEQVAMLFAFPLHWFYRVFSLPISWLNSATTLVLRLFRIQPTSEHELAHSEEELRMILTASGQSGVLKDSEVDLVKHVFEFADKVARDIMVPRVDMVYLDATWPLDRSLQVATNHTFTRFPLCEADPDHVIGMIHIKDLARLAQTGERDIRTIRRDIIFVPESKSIDQLLREFQLRKMHMAAVLDEYGGTAGIATLEDVLEQIVGEIHDEFEEPDPEVQRVDENRLLVDGKVLLIDLKADWEIQLPPNDSETVGGWVLDQVGAIPGTGDTVEADGYRLEVAEMDGQRVRKVLIVRTAPPEAETGTPVATH
jgi:CBS domain containing-hemolysin-like protein